MAGKPQLKTVTKKKALKDGSEKKRKKRLADDVELVPDKPTKPKKKRKVDETEGAATAQDDLTKTKKLSGDRKSEKKKKKKKRIHDECHVKEGKKTAKESVGGCPLPTVECEDEAVTNARDSCEEAGGNKAPQSSSGRAVVEEEDDANVEHSRRRKRGGVSSRRHTTGNRRNILFIGNLPYCCTEERLREFLAMDGMFSAKVLSSCLMCLRVFSDEILSIRMPTDKVKTENSKSCKGYAFVDFTSDGLKKALLLHHQQFLGRKINVELSAGGGGNSNNRKQKIKENNRRMKDWRVRASYCLNMLNELSHLTIAQTKLHSSIQNDKQSL
jgi:nucleolar protein 6